MRNIRPPKSDDWATLVKQARKAARMTQLALAEAAHVARETIWRWETGRQRPENVDTVVAVADALKVKREQALIAAGLHVGQTPAPAKPDPRLRGLEPGDQIVERILAGPWDDEMKTMMLDQLRIRRAQQRAEELADIEFREQMWRQAVAERSVA